ncbi:MAG: hypothetical protein E7677_05745 [Ruminococcaceae bacterium]|nr:hypothetical protein [Oscillospiraceae bacterium]
MKKSTRIIIASIITFIFAAVGFYVVLPAINVFNQELWMYIIAATIIWSAVYIVLGLKNVKGAGIKESLKGAKIVAVVIAIPVVVLIVGNIISSTFFNAEKYSNIITVNEAVFEEDMPESGLVTNIALMDSASAEMYGKRAMGNLADVVSQYQIGATYVQINYKGAPQKIVNLEYVDFFKWANNRENGIPGMVMVDPVNSSAEYVELSTPMKYVESAYFNEDLHRKLRFSYPTKIFGNISFEIDDAGNPYYIVACMAPRVGIFGAYDVNEVIIFNPCDGTSELYALSEVPTWVDNVFTGTLASQKYDWHGTLANGFWNSIIGNKDCKVTTDDFGYIVIEDDVWFFTGVTSVSNDESNIGFIISNARTGEYKFYSVIGAEEYSAMNAAEGAVQEKGYVASFPSLINASGEATYIMVLKDKGGLVKLYALVNVENYSIVATGTTQAEAKEAYIKLLKDEGIIDNDVQIPDSTPEISIETKEKSVTVSQIRFLTLGGESYIYLKDADGVFYKLAVADDEGVLLIDEGSKLDIKYTDSDTNESIKNIVSWTFAEVAS